MIIIFAFLKAYENNSLEKFKGFPPCYLENKKNRAIHYLQITTPKSDTTISGTETQLSTPILSGAAE